MGFYFDRKKKSRFSEGRQKNVPGLVFLLIISSWSNKWGKCVWTRDDKDNKKKFKYNEAYFSNYENV